MSNDAIISVENIGKKFCRSLKRTLVYGVQDISRDVFGRTPESAELRNDEFWALKDVSFEVKRGECLGLIGANGAGKSTLLKLLNGVILPDKGTIRVHGLVGGLLELGAGFHPMLTGRENIHLNGAILGLSKKEIENQFDAIVDFADLGEFIDSPVKYYSSGMYVRLGFAVAACLNPDVLLVDEVLAVGDTAFRLKCMRAIRNRVDSGMAIIVVSHQLGTITNLCSRAVWLEKGVIRNLGQTDDICLSYEKSLPPNPLERRGQPRDGGYLDSNAGAEIVEVRCIPSMAENPIVFSNDEEIRIAVQLLCTNPVPSLTLTYGLRTTDDILAYGSRLELGVLLTGPGFYNVDIKIPPRSLLGGHFYFSCGLSRGKDWGYTIHNIPHCLSLYIVSPSSMKYTRGIADLKATVSFSQLQ
jgi:ABC-type polysaccharide/polyol phosphate transport system ATPase subunit